jgi:hypothetical protein
MKEEQGRRALLFARLEAVEARRFSTWKTNQMWKTTGFPRKI